MRVEHIGNAVLYLGDCLEILPEIGKVDAVVTDPPYGVMLGETNSKQRLKNKRQSYENHPDTPEYIENKVVPAIKLALSKSDRGFITPGTRNCFLYPPPYEMGAWCYLGGKGIGRWGFIGFQPILYYGKDPKLRYGATHSSVIDKHGGKLKLNEHPCAKPLEFMKWAVDKVTFENEIILDPFMGSGTTGVACIELGRKFIGIEINEKYFDVACKRIETANAQGDLFREAV